MSATMSERRKGGVPATMRLDLPAFKAACWARGYDWREIARLAKVARMTQVRIERGGPVAPEVVRRLMAELGKHDPLEIPPAEDNPEATDG